MCVRVRACLSWCGVVCAVVVARRGTQLLKRNPCCWHPMWYHPALRWQPALEQVVAAARLAVTAPSGASFVADCACARIDAQLG